MYNVLYPFVWLIDHSFGYLVQGLFWILSHMLPTEYVGVLTKYGDLFYQGIKYTLGISLFGTIFGFVIAVILASIKVIKIKKNDNIALKGVKYAARGIINVYVAVFRGTPMMVQAMIIFYSLVKFTDIDPVTAGLLIVSINTGAYLTEVIKKGIESVDLGQQEAARALGFSYTKSMLFIVMPQAIKNSMAAIGNEFVINIKDTSVLNVIGCAEMYFVLKTSAASDYRYMETMIVGAIIYLILTLSVTKILSIIDKKMGATAVDIKSSN